jgi:serine/threonine-protein kinase
MSTTYDSPEIEEVELEPTAHFDLDGAADARPGGGIAFAEGTLASLAGETDTLRRHRLLAASAFLAVTFAILSVWVFASDNPGTLAADGSRFSVRVVLIALRCLLAICVAGVLASEAPLSRKQLHVLEYALFGGLTLLIMASQYFVGLDLARRGPEYVPILLAFIKDGVVQTMALMMIYGTLIPNRPAVAARLLVAMFVGVVSVAFLLRFHGDLAPIVAQLTAAEDAGSNILFLGIGATLAIYGAFLVNGLRSELHEARKFGQYRLIRKLGAGGMGEVHLAEHALLKRPCALKLIKQETGGDPVALARFEREVQSSARLAHHNTIEIYDYGHTDDGTFYYVMEYLQGASLGDLVKNFGPLPPGRVIYIFRQVCAGLAEAHELGLVHRDLKPANLFIALHGGETDVAKVLDFGLVKVSDSDSATLTSDMTVSGTPLYMAPEQAVGDRSLDARADIYAVGAMMYYALTGQPPFQGESAFAIMIAHSRDPVVPPSTIRPGIPEDLEKVVLRCLEKSPNDRYMSVRALLEALNQCACASEWGPNRADAWWESVGTAEAAGPRDVSASAEPQSALS